MLCDAASGREGLLFVMGGGITRLLPSEYPARTPTVAFIVLLDELDYGEEHEFRVTVMDAEERELGSGTGKFESVSFEDSGEALLFPGVVPLMDIGLLEAGDYEVRLSIDGLIMARLPLRATPV
jgi:hypothetical protein